MSDEARGSERRWLLDRVVTLQLQAQTSSDAEARAALVLGREALRRHDAESVVRFEAAIKKEIAP